MKKYGYFGNSIEGYMPYKRAFDRNFDSDKADEYSDGFSYDKYNDCDKDDTDLDFDETDSDGF